MTTTTASLSDPAAFGLLPQPHRSRRVLLAAVPEGMPRESDFLLDEVTIPACPANGFARPHDMGLR
jgi:hypothetical protein